MIYYLHIDRTDVVIRDLEGSHHGELASAHAEAVDAAREMMATAVRAGRDITDWQIDIMDEHDVSLAVVAFSSVVSRDAPRVG